VISTEDIFRYSGIISTRKKMNFEQLNLIRWTTETDVQRVKKDLSVIGDEILGI